LEKSGWSFTSSVFEVLRALGKGWAVWPAVDHFVMGIEKGPPGIGVLQKDISYFHQRILAAFVPSKLLQLSVSSVLAGQV
jgi:hypothetical protein